MTQNKKKIKKKKNNNEISANRRWIDLQLLFFNVKQQQNEIEIVKHLSFICVLAYAPKH